MMPLWEELNRSQELLASGKINAALTTAEAILRQSPNDRPVLRHLAQVYWMLGRKDDAEQTLRKCHEIRPNVEISIVLAQMIIQDGRYDEAETLLDQAAALDPGHGGVYLTRGNLAALRGNPEEAIRLYEEAKRVDPYRTSAMADQQIAWVRQQMMSGR